VIAEGKHLAGTNRRRLLPITGYRINRERFAASASFIPASTARLFAVDVATMTRASGVSSKFFNPLARALHRQKPNAQGHKPFAIESLSVKAICRMSYFCSDGARTW
jgi:hypothetical protein